MPLPNGDPLLIFLDTEASQGSRYFADIIELSAVVDPRRTQSSRFKFHTLINTDQKLAKFAIEKCKITPELLRGKPYFPEAFTWFLNWIVNTQKRLGKEWSQRLIPVLVAHGGMENDFVMFLKNMMKYQMDFNKLKEYQIYLADTFELCLKLKRKGVAELQNCKLSMDALFKNFCPNDNFQGQHQAMADVQAMIKIFIESPLKDYINELEYHPFYERYCKVEASEQSMENKETLKGSLPKLSQCQSNMTLCRLLRNGYTYESLQDFFRQCTSPLDFFDAMKEIGVTRKTSRAIVMEFEGLGVSCKGMTTPESQDIENDIMSGHEEPNLSSPTSIQLLASAAKEDCTLYSCRSLNRSDSGYSSQSTCRSLSVEEEEALHLESSAINQHIIFGEFDADESILEYCPTAVDFLSCPAGSVSQQQSACVDKIKITTKNGEQLSQFGNSVSLTEYMFTALEEAKADKSKISKEGSIEFGVSKFMVDEEDTEYWDDEVDDFKPFEISFEKVIPLGLCSEDIDCGVPTGQPLCNIPLPRDINTRECESKPRWTPNLNTS